MIHFFILLSSKHDNLRAIILLDFYIPITKFLLLHLPKAIPCVHLLSIDFQYY